MWTSGTSGSAARKSATNEAAVAAWIGFWAHGTVRDVTVEAISDAGYAWGLFVGSEDPEVVVLNDVSIVARAAIHAAGLFTGATRREPHRE